MNPDVTVLIVTYRQGSTIRRAIESAVAQTARTRMKIIVSDDTSPDETYVRAVAATARHPDVEVRRNNHNMGTMQHYRHLAEMITTPYVAILEGDDVWSSNTKIERQVTLLEGYPEAAMCFTACELVEDDKPARLHPTFASFNRLRSLDVIDLLHENSPATFSNCLYRSELFKKAMASTKDVRGFDWIVNLLVAVERPVIFDPVPSTKYYLHSQGQWSQLSRLEKAQMIDGTLSAFNALTGLKYAPYIQEAKKPFAHGARA